MNATLDANTMKWSISVPGVTVISANRELLFAGYMALMLDSALPKPDVTDPLEMHIKTDLSFQILRELRKCTPLSLNGKAPHKNFVYLTSAHCRAL